MYPICSDDCTYFKSAASASFELLAICVSTCLESSFPQQKPFWDRISINKLVNQLRLQYIANLSSKHNTHQTGFQVIHSLIKEGCSNIRTVIFFHWQQGNNPFKLKCQGTCAHDNHLFMLVLHLQKKTIKSQNMILHFFFFF